VLSDSVVHLISSRKNKLVVTKGPTSALVSIKIKRWSL